VEAILGEEQKGWREGKSIEGNARGIGGAWGGGDPGFFPLTDRPAAVECN
jgi:hypothetical protein